MKPKIILILAFLIGDYSFLGAQTDTLNQPHMNYKVQKEYDENGNIIRYDSSYSYSYSSPGFNNFQLDSFPSFPELFNPDFMEEFFNSSPWMMDSLFDFQYQFRPFLDDSLMNSFFDFPIDHYRDKFYYEYQFQHLDSLMKRYQFMIDSMYNAPDSLSIPVQPNKNKKILKTTPI